MAQQDFFLAENDIASFWLGIEENTIFALELVEHNSQLSKQKLQQRFRNACFHSQIPMNVDSLVKRIWQFDADLPIKFITGTPWLQLVWRTACRIPVGSTISYQELAQWVNHPKACRAVANALHVNPIAIIVPCHRIIRKSGELGGFGAGINIKKKLLAYEQRVKMDV